MTISEFGAAGTRFESWVAYGVFLPVGLAALAAALLLLGDGPLEYARVGAATLAACLGIAYAGAGMAPINARGAPSNRRHTLHQLAGSFEYVGGPMALIYACEGPASIWLASAAVIAAVTALASTMSRWSPWAGALQRVADGTLWGSLLALAATLR